MDILSPPMMLSPLGWRFTPYAAAILAQYEGHHPLEITVPTKFAGTAVEQSIVSTFPQQYDTLILGISSKIGDADHGDSGQQVFLKITHNATGLSWNSSAPGDSSPVTGLAGACGQVNPIMPLPEAFFLPAKTWLRHNWVNSNSSIFGAVTGGTITYKAIQLTKPIGGERPTHVTLPDGCTIPIGSRLPWFFSVGIGEEFTNTAWPNNVEYIIGTHQKTINYTEPEGCDVELQACNTNFNAQSGRSYTISKILMKLADVGQPRLAQPEQCDQAAIFGNYAQAQPAALLQLPYLLKRTHRLQISTLIGDGFPGSVSAVLNGFVTFSGVRRTCEGIY